MAGVTELGYVRFGVADLAEWREFASDILGLEVVDDGPQNTLFLRSDLWHHRIILEQDGADDLTAAELYFVAVNGVVLFYFDNQFGITQSNSVTGRRAEHLCIGLSR